MSVSEVKSFDTHARASRGTRPQYARLSRAGHGILPETLGHERTLPVRMLPLPVFIGSYARGDLRASPKI